MPAFTHLKVYSSYSLGVGLNTPQEICASAARLGYSSVALTDVGGTYGFVEFHLAGKQHGIKPIYGTVVAHYPVGARTEERHDLTLVAVSREGLRHVAALASFCATAVETGTALDIEVLGANADGVVAFMGAPGSEIAKLLTGDDGEGARRVVGVFKEIFGDRLFIEVQDHGGGDERALVGRLLALAGQTQTAPLLTQEVRYVEKGIRELYGALRGIRDAGEARDFFRIEREPRDWSMKSPLEMSQMRPFYEAAFENASRVDEMVPGDLMGHLDDAWPEGNALDRDAVRREILERCATVLREHAGRRPEPARFSYREVLEREVEEAVAEDVGPTLLFFHRILSQLREARVDSGPATGLSLQSLCAYFLGITCFDPYEYDARHYPAFDARIKDTREFELQLTPETRSEAVHALFSSFDFGQVAYLPAIERVSPLKAIRMAASVVEVPEGEYREIRDVLDRQPGVPIEKLYEQNDNVAKLYRRSLAARDLLRRAALLEDLPAGIIRSRRSLALSPAPLTDFLGHSIDSDTGDLFIQAGREDFPLAHVFRVDVTSLNALSVAVRAEEEIRRQGLAGYGWEGLPIEDAMVWRRIQGGDAAGVFLFEGQTTIKRRDSFELSCIEDLTNFLALMRSRDTGETAGERIDSYQTRPTDAFDEEAVAEVLRTTRGQVLYDEQVRDILCALAGVTPSDGWKMFHDLRTPSPGALAAVRSRFMRGAAERGVAVEAANRWFERLMRLAKTTMSHGRVFADALLVYKLFFLKTHHEAAFWAALLNTNLENESKSERYLGTLRARGMVLPVDANRSDVGFAVEEDRFIRTGLCNIRSFDAEKGRRVVSARMKRPFDSLEDFVRRVGRKHIGRGDVRVLIDAGAFDSFGVERADLRNELRVVFRPARPKAKKEGQGQLELPLND